MVRDPIEFAGPAPSEICPHGAAPEEHCPVCDEAEPDDEVTDCPHGKRQDQACQVCDELWQDPLIEEDLS